jgi:hypothetical protein
MQINLCENYRATQLIKHVVQPRDRMTISYSNIINGSTVNTHMSGVIFLWNQKCRNGTRTKTFTYIPAVQKVLNFSLNFLSLLGVCSICSTVWQRCSWNQINLMLYPSHWWNSWGISAGKMSSYSCKRLVTTGGTELGISS